MWNHILNFQFTNWVCFSRFLSFKTSSKLWAIINSKVQSQLFSYMLQFRLCGAKDILSIFSVTTPTSVWHESSYVFSTLWLGLTFSVDKSLSCLKIHQWLLKFERDILFYCFQMIKIWQSPSWDSSGRCNICGALCKLSLVIETNCSSGIPLKNIIVDM